jgi:hypothetical protein
VCKRAAIVKGGCGVGLPFLACLRVSGMTSLPSFHGFAPLLAPVKWPGAHGLGFPILISTETGVRQTLCVGLKRPFTSFTPVSEGHFQGISRETLNP